MRYTEDIIVRSYDIDFTGHAKLSAIFGYLQEAAVRGAHASGIGYDDLYPKGLGWMLSQYRVCISKKFRLGERLSIETWASGTERLFFTREFKIMSGVDVAAIATSRWVLVDLNKKRPVRPTVLEGFEAHSVYDYVFDDGIPEIKKSDICDFVLAKKNQIHRR